MERTWNKRGKRLASWVLAALLATQAAPGAYGAGGQANGANSETQIASPVEKVYINSYGGSQRSTDFNAHWKFNLGDAGGAEAPEYDDSAWRDVNLPHDYSIEQPYSSSNEAESGYLPGGIGWYRKHFTLDPSWSGKRLSIHFDGAYMNTEVYLNGTKLGFHPYGYTPFSMELPAELLRFDSENVIAVKTNNRIPSSRWYSGSGIYRDVTLIATDPVHIAPDGITVLTPDIADGTGTVQIAAKVANDSAAEVQGLTVSHTITEQGSEQSVATAEGSVASIGSGAAQTVSATATVPSPKLWNVWDKGAQNLYVVHTEVKQGDQVLDSYDTTFGFRYFTFDQQGFSLNGERMKLRGVCMHHDQGALGAEAWYRATERQVEILKEMGCNAIRVTHNPASQALLDICNEQGMLVVEEAFDTWTQQKNYNTNDYSAWFNTRIESGNNIEGGVPGSMTWAEFDVKAMVSRGKNAPCIIMWSLGNEILETTQYDFSQYTTYAQNLIDWVKQVDTTRPVTFGDNKLKANNGTAKNIAAVIHRNGGIVGYNYATNQQMSSVSAGDWLIYGSETASAVNSSGVYNYIGGGGQTGNQRLTSYDTSAVGWGAVASDAWYRTITMDRNAGEFVWTGFDYIGEPTPWNGTSGGSQTGNFAVAPKSSYFGIVDTTGFPKDSYYFYQSQWNDQVNTLHILPTWNEEDVLKDGQGKVRVVVYTDAAEIKLFLNDEEIGTAKAVKSAPSAAGYTYATFTSDSKNFQKKTGHESLYATFLVPYEAGTLRAEAYDSSGNRIPDEQLKGRTQVKTTQPASQLSLSADREEIRADGKDLSYITIDVTDRNGQPVNGAEPTISLSISGDGEIIGVDSGAQFDHTSNQSLTWKAFHGKLLAIVQSTTNDGTFTVTAKADGMLSDSVTVRTTPVAAGTEKVVSSLEYARTYYVKVGHEPVLPTTMQVNYSDGTSEQKAVTWSGAGDTTQPGSFSMTGTIDGLPTTASVRVVMLDTVAALMNYSCAVAVGAAANLPATRPAVTAAGEVLDAYFPVTWDAVNTDQPGLYPVTGHATVFGEELTLTASVRVSEGQVHTGSNMAPRVVELYHGTESDNQTGALRVICDEDKNAEKYWSGSGEVRFRYDTAQNINQVKLYLRDTAPASRDMHLEWSPDGASWSRIDAKVSNAADAGMTIRTYDFDIVSAVWIKLVFDAPVNLVEAELNTGIPSFAVGSEAALSALRVKGRIADANALAAGVFSTPEADVTLADITAAGKDNASVTLLPAQEQVIRLLLESEDHASRATFQILLGNSSGLVTDPASDQLDYDRTRITATAGSANADNTGHTEGPAHYVLDNNAGTIWHSNWDVGAGDADLSDNPELRWLQLTLEEETEINALRYLPRAGGAGSANGRVKDYRIEVSTTGEPDSWQTVARGSWPNTEGWKIAPFTQAVSAKYVRLWGENTYGDVANKFMSAAEVRVSKPASDLFLLADAALPQQSYDYTGQAITPVPVVTRKDDGSPLTEGTDYTVSYANNIQPGTATVTIRGAGTYTGVLEATFEIRPVEIGVVSYEPVEVNTGKDVPPQLPGTVTANMSAGGQQIFEVVWAEVDPSRYAKLGEFEVYGTVVGQTLPVTAHVTVSGITGVENIALVTMPGVEPALPATVHVYLSDDQVGTAPVDWEQVDYNGNARQIITVTGRVRGTDMQTTAFVRLADLTESADNLALNSDVNLNGSDGDLPLAIAWVSAGNDNPFKATNGRKDFASDGSKVVWTDWESNTFHMQQNWMGVILGSGDTVESRMLHEVSVGFMEEDGGGASKVKLPADYKIEYYVGPEGFAYQTKLSKESLKNQGNGFVRNWADSNPLKDDANWREVTYTGEKPAVPALDSFKKMINVGFEPVQTQAIRISLTPQASQWVGIEEFEVYGYEPPELNHSFNLSYIRLDGVDRLSEFVDNTLEVHLEADDAIPTVTAAATDNAAVSVVQGYDRNSTAKVIVKAEDGTGEQVYRIRFTADQETLHPVQYQLYHLTADPKPVDVADGQRLELALHAPAGYQLPDTVQVWMGGAMLENGNGYTYDQATGALAIPAVTGGVVVVAEGVVPVGTAKEIESFTVAGGSVQITGTEIHVTVPFGTDISMLAPVIVVSERATVSPASGEPQDFRTPVVYTVTAEDGSQQSYTVYVQVAEAGVYVISPDTVAHGVIQVSRQSAAEGERIEITTVPDHGYALKPGSVRAYQTGDESVTVPVEGSAFLMPAHAVTVTAEFEPAAPEPVYCEVTFQTNGGSSVPGQRVQEGERVSRPSDPTRSGYRFTGWYADAALTKAYDFAAPVTGNLTLYAGWERTGDSGSSGSGDKTETHRNPDGSTTTTVTKKDGTVIETTRHPDGASEVVQKNPDGSSVETRTLTDGTSVVTRTDTRGRQQIAVKLSAEALGQARESGRMVTLPIDDVPHTGSRDQAPPITVEMPGNDAVLIEIPVSGVTAGTVAVLVKPDGAEQVIRTTKTTWDGVAVELRSGDTVKIVDNSKSFGDVPASYWGAEAVAFASSRALFDGTGANRFEPEAPMTRAMILTVLARYDGVNTAGGATWYEAGRNWAIEQRISDGTGMEQNLTREQLVTMLYRYAGEPLVTGARTGGFGDSAQISAYAQRSMEWAIEQGLITGVGNNRLDPQGQATRAQVAAILQRFIQNAA